MRDACGTRGDPEELVMAIMSLLEGLWTDFHAHPDEFSREGAAEICPTTARAFFPDYSERREKAAGSGLMGPVAQRPAGRLFRPGCRRQSP
ncbi:TetR family transcriptional regulator C-terminal domain-containing protein [Leisingera daeponensis]|nr:TetR family transcriptional regulator C-terminal domain-containing protein [Leisingera daeponensis]